MKDFLDFDELFNKFKIDILMKHAQGKPLSEDLVQAFLKLHSTIDSLLARVGRRMVVAAQGVQSSLQNENIAKMLSLFESLFVGNDEGQPPQLIEFLEQNKTDVIAKNDLNAENITNKISGIAH